MDAHELRTSVNSSGWNSYAKTSCREHLEYVVTDKWRAIYAIGERTHTSEPKHVNVDGRTTFYSKFDGY